MIGGLKEVFDEKNNTQDIATELDVALECLGDSNGCPEGANCIENGTDASERVCKECWRMHIEKIAKEKSNV